MILQRSNNLQALQCSMRTVRYFRPTHQKRFLPNLVMGESLLCWKQQAGYLSIGTPSDKHHVGAIALTLDVILLAVSFGVLFVVKRLLKPRVHMD